MQRERVRPSGHVVQRLDRLNLPCQTCRPDARCADHHHDEQLVTRYTDTYATTLSDVLAGMDPDDIAIMMRPGHHTAPAVSAAGPALMTRLRGLAASGPVILELHGRTVMIDQDGPVLLGYPLATGSGL